MTTSKKERAKDIIATILFISLIFSVIFSLVRFIMAPVEMPEGHYEKVKSDYLLMLFQCFMGLIVMLLPSIMSKRFNIMLPSTIVIIYYLFLYCAIFLGEVFEFYYLIPHWDSILHAFSGAMLGAIGFVLVDFLNKDEHVKMSLSPAFVSIFAFSFALAAGALWEIYEFTFDGLLGLNMQKFKTAEGVLLIGRDALSDTMKDIIIDGIAAAAIAILGFFQNKHFFIKRHAKLNAQREEILSPNAGGADVISENSADIQNTVTGAEPDDTNKA